MDRRSKPPLAGFDSSTAMLRALAAHLHGREFPLLGLPPPWSAPAFQALGAVVNRLPLPARQAVFRVGGWLESVSLRRLGKPVVDEASAWAASLYPKRTYPAVAVGSSNGAATHLWAALGIPWLPQTALVAVSRPGGDPDDPGAELRWGLEPGREFLRANPDADLHHMHDPSQDRLMVRRMAYFRYKRRTLGKAYEQFISERLAPGGSIFSVECGLSWPITRVSGRHFFQFGALGGPSAEEYHQGGPRVVEYLAKQGSHRTRWEPPRPDGNAPEAEWGFGSAFGQDLERFAGERGYRVRALRFEQPEDLSPLVADLYRWWLNSRGIEDPPLVVESFIVMEPHWVLRSASVPFWMVFNTEPSRDALGRYLDVGPAWDEILLTLFSHGVDSIGVPGIEEWRRLLQRARSEGRFFGVDERAYPADFGVFARYHSDLRRKLPAPGPVPRPLDLAELDAFLELHPERYRLSWT
ncbi:MAG: hypothetical protein HY900_33425 [Deltaproteobacteria bacterium]|nr:hypothetical protein [Deltaproteobacteria bacterium]